MIADATGGMPSFAAQEIDGDVRGDLQDESLAVANAHRDVFQSGQAYPGFLKRIVGQVDTPCPPLQGETQFLELA